MDNLIDTGWTYTTTACRAEGTPPIDIETLKAVTAKMREHIDRLTEAAFLCVDQATSDRLWTLAEETARQYDTPDKVEAYYQVALKVVAAGMAREPFWKMTIPEPKVEYDFVFRPRWRLG